MLLLTACAALAPAQTSPQLAITPPGLVTIKQGGTAPVTVTATLNEGFHLNSHTPSDNYLIPLTLKWQPGVLEETGMVYPTPQMLKTGGLDKPLSVVTGKFEIVTKFKAAASAAPGPATVTGKLRYQACNDKECFPPKTLDVKVAVEVK